VDLIEVIHSESTLNKRGGHKPTFYRVADDRSVVTDFYFGKIMEAFYMNRRLVFNAFVSRCTLTIASHFFRYIAAHE